MSDVAQRISSAERPAGSVGSDSGRSGGLTVTLDRPQTLSRRAYDQILQSIRDETLERDRHYSENELAVSLGISRTPVREALLDLARQGLVEIFPQRGFRVRELSDAERTEIFEVRGVLEAYVVERLAKMVTPEMVTRLTDLLAAQSEAADDPTTFLIIDEEFHLLMPEMAGLIRTCDMLSTLRGAMWLIGSSALSTPHRVPAVLCEHQAIVEAIAAHEPVKAARALRKHISATAEAVHKAATGG